MTAFNWDLLTQEYFLRYFFCRYKKSNQKKSFATKKLAPPTRQAAYGFAQQFLLQYCAPSARVIFVSLQQKYSVQNKN
jgi:hypothetical protein